MENVKHILGFPEFIQEVGNVYPIKVKDCEKFNIHSHVLYINKKHFENADNYELLDLLIFVENGKFINDLQEVFSLALREKVVFVADEFDYAFIVNENNIIKKSNYDQLRQIIMTQNLLFEQKVYKDKLVQEWANLAMQAKNKNGVKITIEDMISSISVYTGKSYEQIAEQTIYQLHADFKRICKFKEYDTSVDFKCAGAEKVSINHFAEWINMFENPYENLFVSKDKLSNINKAFQ